MGKTTAATSSTARLFGEPSGGRGKAYKVYRWYEHETGRYARPDPELLLPPDLEPRYAYARGAPTVFIDLLGRLALFCCREVQLEVGVIDIDSRYKHCFIWVDHERYSLFRIKTESGEHVGQTIKNDPLFRDTRYSKNAFCSPCLPNCSDQATCFDKAYKAYPKITPYRLFRGPNSNTFAATLANKCCTGVPPDILGEPRIPGLTNPPPGPWPGPKP